MNPFDNIEAHARFEIQSVMEDKPEIHHSKSGVIELMVMAYVRGATFMHERLTDDSTEAKSDAP